MEIIPRYTARGSSNLKAGPFGHPEELATKLGSSFLETRSFTVELQPSWAAGPGSWATPNHMVTKTQSLLLN